MINIYKKIKAREIFTQSKIKYLRYAFGEIILIVLGILIALSVNNWNENRKQHKVAINYINGVYNDLQLDTTKFNHIIHGFKGFMKFKEWSLEQKNLEQYPIEQIEQTIYMTYLDTKMNDRMFQKMQNSDFLTISKYENLFDQINDYYTTQKEQLTRMNKWDEESSNREDDFWEYQNDFEIHQPTDSTSIFQSTKERKSKLLQKITSIEGRNYLKLDLFRKKYVLKVYEEINGKAINLLERIEKEGFIKE